ncbi:transcription/translation regulatory transformer protein RfaH [Gallaecimonas kandeliae]|uniref:transcription/translation regulatory transformer protein RfaH n=1 Tax=Gallaecimonas kandeliae TaxID=3029055 RepID=UPI002647032A|nr:transcription/translation regulatory transformer protein RfaH [Gallaecimonas kandeliae]WKE66780.1 transcription/translation regulatory transformer protein RfaH [Gallaecimonas kandeliae]
MLGWYLVYCRAKQEMRAKANLMNQGFETYLPRILATDIQRGRRQTAERVLFPNYLFVHIDPTAGDYYKVRSTRGVHGFVRCGESPVRVPGKLIKTLVLNEERLESQGALDSGFKAGQKIRLLNGPFKGLSAVYQMEDGEERAKVMVELLSHHSSISISLKDIERL